MDQDAMMLAGSVTRTWLCSVYLDHGQDITPGRFSLHLQENRNVFEIILSITNVIQNDASYVTHTKVQTAKKLSFGSEESNQQ